MTFSTRSLASAADRPARVSRVAVVVARHDGWQPLFMSGSLGADVATGRIPQERDVQVQLALGHMRQALAAAGMDCRHVVFFDPYLSAAASRQSNAVSAVR